MKRPRRWPTTPEFPRETGALFGGGVRIVGGLGAGLQFTQVKYEYTVGLGINIPHPTIFQRFATDTDVTASTLERTDNALDISASYQIPTPDTWRVRVFGGPTFFAMKQDLVSLIRYSQQFSLLGTNIVDITGFDEETADESVWGVPCRGRRGVLLLSPLRVGGGICVNSGIVNLASEPLTGGEAELKLGSTLVGGGLRIRF